MMSIFLANPNIYYLQNTFNYIKLLQFPQKQTTRQSPLNYHTPIHYM